MPSVRKIKCSSGSPIAQRGAHSRNDPLRFSLERSSLVFDRQLGAGDGKMTKLRRFRLPLEKGTATNRALRRQWGAKGVDQSADRGGWPTLLAQASHIPQPYTDRSDGPRYR